MERVMYALDFLGKLRIWVGIGGVVVVMVVGGDRSDIFKEKAPL